MASLFKDPNQISAYRDRRFNGTQEEFDNALRTSCTAYVGNLSFYTTEEQIYELFSRVGEINKIIMGLDKNTKTPCGFCFIMYYTREDTEDAVKYIHGTCLDSRSIRVDFDWGFQEDRRWGRGRSGGQVRDEHRLDYDPDRGGYGKLAQKEMERRRQLVDYGVGSFGYAGVPNSSSHGGHGAYGGSHRPSREYPSKRYRSEDDRSTTDSSRRGYDRESRPAKNPRFREKGDSDDEDNGKH